MQKETLTLDKIIYDYKKEFFSSIKIVLIMPFIFILLIAFLIYLFSCLENKNLVLEILMISPPTFFLFLCLAVLWDSYKDYKVVKKQLFKIVIDKLIGSDEKKTYIGSPFIASFSHPYILVFASYGEYCIPPKNHRSSNLYNMNDKAVFNYSDIGDTFYLVITKKGKILLAYNTKLFELENNIKISALQL